MANFAEVIPGEASETDDDDDNGEKGDSDDTDEKGNSAEKNGTANAINAISKQRMQYRWSTHVDEKLEERWQMLGKDAAQLVVRQSKSLRKHLGTLRHNIANTHRTLQVISSYLKKSAENLEGRVEPNISMLRDGAALVPDFSNFQHKILNNDSSQHQ